MNEVRECVTDSNERKYGLWELKDEKMASRKCKCCGVEFERPITKEILNQIKKQYEAIALVESFLILDIEDPNLIGYLNVILEDAVDFIEDDKKVLLDRKLVDIYNSSIVSEENRMMIDSFRKAIIANDNDLFFDTMEYFKGYNKECLDNFFIGSNDRTR